jgi:hypothetical protein
VFIDAAQVVLAQILATIFFANESHNVQARVEFDPSRVVQPPLDFGRWIKVRDLGGGLTGVLLDPADVLVRDQNDRLSTTVSTTRTPEV